MPLKRGRAMPWVVTLVVAVGSAGLAPGANGEVGDSFLRPPQVGTTVEPDGLGAGLLYPTIEPSESPPVDTAEVIVAPETIEPVGLDSASDPAERTQISAKTEEEGGEDYDPWEPFNERMFSFNHDVLDRFVLKPVATGWDKVLPDPVKRGLGRAFDNLGMPRRLVNHLFQGNGPGVERELARFLLNSTIGIAGFFDVAEKLGIEKSDADTGQTLGVYGAGPGPYLVLPFVPPLTVRDAIGSAVDLALDPLSYLLPFAANAGMTAGKTVNERALNLQFFQDVEESVFDLYGAVRNGYLQRRRAAIEERAAEAKKNLDAIRKAEPWREMGRWR